MGEGASQEKRGGERERAFDDVWGGLGIARHASRLTVQQTITPHTFAPEEEEEDEPLEDPQREDAGHVGEGVTVLASAPPAERKAARSPLATGQWGPEVRNMPSESLPTIAWSRRVHEGEPEDLSGSTQPDLLFLERIGRGGMGEVHMAQQHSLKRKVAVKKLIPPLRDGRRAALVREARITGLLEHPNIVPVHALGLDPSGAPLMVMKPVEGVPWDRLVAARRGKLGDEDFPQGEHLADEIERLLQVCRAVEFAHARGVLHRDIKPENVMLGGFGEVYLVDWGIALQMDSREATGPFVGTPAFMAPEMLSTSELDVDERTDVYLLGATLHAVLTGRSRHSGAGVHAVLFAAFESAPVAYPREVPEELAAICNRATAKDPDARFPTALAFSDALRVFLRRRSAVALTTAASARLDEARAQLRGLMRRPDIADAHDDDNLHASTLLRRRIAEARFGFQEALRQLPDMESARRGLEDSQVLAVETEVALNNPGGAEAALQEAEQPSQALCDAVAALRQRHQQMARDAAALASVRYQSDGSVSTRTRSFTMLALGAITLLITSVTYGARLTRGLEMTHAIATTVSVGLAVIFAASMLLVGRKLMVNAFNRQAASLIGVIVGFSLLFRVAAWRLEVPPLEAYVLEWAGIAGVLAVAGFVVQRLFFGAAVAMVVATFLSAAWPFHSSIIGAGGIFLGSVICAAGWWPKRQEKPTPT